MHIGIFNAVRIIWWGAIGQAFACDGVEFEPQLEMEERHFANAAFFAPASAYLTFVTAAHLSWGSTYELVLLIRTAAHLNWCL